MHCEITLRDGRSVLVRSPLPEEKARHPSCRQRALEVMAHNARAIRLYEREGYRIAMVHPGAVCFPDGRVADEYLMIKKL